MKERWSEKIKVGQLCDKLQKHVLGEEEMTQTQINAARILLGKVMPDMKSVEVKDITKVGVEELTTAELQELARGEVPERLDTRTLN